MWLYSKGCGYIAQNPFQRSIKFAFATILHTIFTPFLSSVSHQSAISQSSVSHQSVISQSVISQLMTPSSLPSSLQPQLASFIFATFKTFCLVNIWWQQQIVWKCSWSVFFTDSRQNWAGFPSELMVFTLKTSGLGDKTNCLALLWII